MNDYYDSLYRTEPQDDYQQYEAPQYLPQRYAPPPPASPARPARFTPAEAFWYVLGNISFGAMYMAKVPAKKALEEVGLGTMTSAERFWYVLQCLALGAGYFAKLPVKRALLEVAPYNQAAKAAGL